MAHSPESRWPKPGVPANLNPRRSGHSASLVYDTPENRAHDRQAHEEPALCTDEKE